MNRITDRQNEERQVSRLSAQRSLYAKAKQVFLAQAILSGPLAVVLAVVVLFYPATKGVVSLWAAVVLLADLAWLSPWQKRLRESAAGIQEQFDCEVLRLPWNEIKAGKKPDPELIAEHDAKYQRWASTMPPLVNWYDVSVQRVPLHLGRLICQRSNCWWDAHQRRRYALVVGVWVAVIFAAVLGFSITKDFTVEDFLVKVVAPLAPLLALGYRQIQEQMQAASRLTKLKDHAVRLWDEALRGRAAAAVTAESRILQDEILESRKRSPLIFDWLFRRVRNDMELSMNRAAQSLVDEAATTIANNPSLLTGEEDDAR